MSKECPICGDTENIYYLRSCYFNCPNPNATEAPPFAYRRDSFACDSCGFFCSQEHIDKIASRLHEKRKAEIALELFKEFDRSVPPSKKFENDWDKFMNWLEEKAKEEK